MGKSLGTTGKDSESFRGDDSGKNYDAIGTKIDQDTVIMMWGLDDLRRMDQQALCKAVFEYKAKVSIKKMKSIAHENSQEPAIDTTLHAFPLLPDQGKDEYEALDDTCDQNITPGHDAVTSPSTAPTVLTSGGRRSSVRPTTEFIIFFFFLVVVGSSFAAALDNIDALVCYCSIPKSRGAKIRWEGVYADQRRPSRPPTGLSEVIRCCRCDAGPSRRPSSSSSREPAGSR